MSDYTPDRWLMVKLTNKNEEVHYRVFATWYGGFLGSDSWKLNSGVTKVALNDCVYEFKGSSGSVYHCRNTGYGSSGYGFSVLRGLIDKSAPDLRIEEMPEETDFLTLDYK